MTLKDSLLIIIVFISSAYALIGQESNRDSYKHSIYWNAGQLLAFPAAFQVGYERRISKKAFVDIEAGYLLYAESLYNSERSGYKIEPGIKFFISEKFSAGPKIQFKKVNIDYTEWVGRYNFSYFEELSFAAERTVIGVLSEFGYHIFPDKNTFAFEFVLAVGFGNINVTHMDLPSDAELDAGFEFFQQAGNYFIPMYRYGFKVKYILGNKSQ